MTNTADERTVADLRVAGLLAAGLMVIGALLGLVWSAWSGAQQAAYVVAPGQLYPYQEVETMAASDGRYFVIVAAVGVIAALVAWFVAKRHRGPIVVLALLVGGLAGSALTWWIGYLTGGGTYHGATGSTIARLPLSLHMPGLVVVQPAIATLLYGLFVAFAARDDLGRPDPVHDRLSVRAGSESEDGGGHGDRAGPLEQGEFPA